MRRILALALLMILLTGSAFAAEIDVASMSVDELREMRSDIEAELIARDASDSDLIYRGVYTVGTDIKEGAYVISFDGSPNDTSARAVIFPSVEEYEKYVVADNDEGIQATRWIAYEGEESFIRLKNDTVFMLGITCRIRPADGEIWRP